MIDLACETPLTLEDAAAALPGVGGEPIHVQTIRRWAAKGLRGIKLETTICGGRRYTSLAAISRFCDALTQLRDGPAKPPARRRRSAHSHQRAMKALADRHGIS